MAIKRILIPVDFSSYSEAAVCLGAELARDSGTEVVLLHVDPIPGFATITTEPMYVPPQLFDAIRRNHDNEIAAKLEAAAALLRGVYSRVESRQGDVVGGILDYAIGWNPDLIIIGSTGMSGAARLFLGSTAEKISKMAPCPVLVSKGRDAQAPITGRFDRVLAAVDYSSFSAPSVESARALLSDTGALEVLHVWHEPYISALNATLGGDVEGLFEAIERGREHEVAQLSAFVADLGLDLEPSQLSSYVCSGAIAGTILERADQLDADLIVLGAHSGDTVSERVIGTVADRVLRHSEREVLLLPSGAVQAV